SGSSLYLGNGDGTFQNSEYVGWGGNQPAAVGDIDADGKLDVALIKSEVHYSFDESGNYYDPVTTHSVGVLLGFGDGSFAEPIVLDFGTTAGLSYFTSPELADFDGDGLPDLAT